MHKERIEVLLGILVLIAVCVGVYFLAPQRSQNTESLEQGIVTPPPITPALAAKIQESTGFDALVSYTARGFEPVSTSIDAGQTVRFVNNKRGANLWIAAYAEGGAIYPGGVSDCGQSAFDACATLLPGEFWEFTFEHAGTWSFKNNAEPSNVGVIIVQ